MDRDETRAHMDITLVRNATVIIEYAGRRLLVDPDFGPKHSRPAFADRSKNPMVDLPIAPGDILKGMDAVFISHLHSDHFDDVAQSMVPKDIRLFCQPDDQTRIADMGFTNLTAVNESVSWGPATITRTGGRHGEGPIGRMMGPVSGCVLQAPGEPTLYWAGDTILCDDVRAAVQSFNPDIIVIHASGAVWPDDSGQPVHIVMDDAQTVELCRLAPNSVIVAVHMEALDHGTVTRANLRDRARAQNIADNQLMIPADGQTLTFNKR